MKVVEIHHPPSVALLIERFGGRRLPFVLDSSQSNDGLGQWSFFGADPFCVFRGKDGSYAVAERSAEVGGTSFRGPDPIEGRWDGAGAGVDGLDALRELMGCFSAPSHETGIPFVGGAVGSIAYDYGRQIERIGQKAVDDRGVPDLHFGLYDGIAALNHETGVLHLIALGIRGDRGAVIAELRELVGGCSGTGSSGSGTPETGVAPRLLGDWQWNMTPGEFSAKVGQVRGYIASGDVYQVNLSQRARCAFEGDPIRVFQALRTGNPAPYAAFIDGGDMQVISTSPEQFLRKRGRSVETRPIKGTRPRGVDVAEDERHAEALRVSEKDRAELLMIVDLERNDLGRVAEFGSVHVEGLYHLERYKRVMHQTAQVKARLAADKDVFDCIRALFPGGSITGAPKVRAMELIEELEPTRRGVYCGSVGYIGFDGDAELNIAIRSLQLKDGWLDYQVGSGIVWDSDPEGEYQETLDKGRALRETIDALCLKS